MLTPVGREIFPGYPTKRGASGVKFFSPLFMHAHAQLPNLLQ